MNLKKIIKANKKPVIFILLLLVVIGVGTSIAYFYREVSIPNKFKTMTYNVGVEEEFYDDWGTKKVKFVNREATNVSVVLRINYNEIWKKKVDDVDVILNNNTNGKNNVNKEWTKAFEDDFIDGGDGWYYYKKILKGEEEVQVLNSVTLDEELIKLSPYYQDYKVASYELIFNFETIQADAKAVREIWDKNISIESDDVTWNL